MKLQRSKLTCDCKDSIFIGVPCRHLIALVSKEKVLDFKALPINPRWRKDFYVEKEEEKDQVDLQPQEKEKEDSEINPTLSQGLSVILHIFFLNIIDSKS